METLPPLLSASLRFGVAGLLLVAYLGLRRGAVLGVGLGFLGVAVLLLPGARPEGVAVLPAAVVVLSSVLWAIGSFAATRTALPPDALLTTVIQMAGGCAGLAIAGVLRGESLDVSRVSSASLLALGYLVVFGSIVAFTAYSWLLGVAPVSQVATYAYVNPVVAVLLGALLAQEALGLPTLVGGAVTVLSVALVVREQSRRKRGQAVEEVRTPTSGTAGTAAP